MSIGHSKHSRNGFTLLEVIIAITILAFISIFTANMIQQGVKAKRKIQAEIDRRGSLQSALNLMSQDIRRAFHYRDINTEVYNAAQTARRKKATQPDPPPAPQTPKVLTPDEEEKFKLKEVRTYTRFMGEKDKLDFTSLNNFRPTKNIQQSDQAEIGYYLQSCTSRVKKDITSECLWRRVSPYIDSEVKEGGRSMVLLENIKSLQFRYIGNGHEEEWVEAWRTEGAEEVMKNRFPYAVEISIVAQDIKFDPPKEIAMTIVAPLQFTAENAPTDPVAEEGAPL